MDQKIDDFPMKLVNRIATVCGSSVKNGIDWDYNAYVALWSIEAKVNKKPIQLIGKGLTYRDACIDFIVKLMNKKITITTYRKNPQGYLTSKIRRCIIQSKFMEIYFEGKEIIYDSNLEYTVKDIHKDVDV